MKKKILVLGGSYFFGRWFVQYAKKSFDITVANRGNIPVNLPDVNEIRMDRNIEADRMALSDLKFDAIVDFCAYHEGDIKNILSVPGLKTERYIFISTVDVYKRVPEAMIGVDGEIESRFDAGPAGEYIRGKVSLEHEISAISRDSDITFTSVRPSILYGPANYAPRESLFFDMIRQYQNVIVPVDATGFFQMTYVGDAAKVLLYICESGDPEDRVNLCSNRIDNYRSFIDALHDIPGADFTETGITISDMLNQNIILPFPVTREESQGYEGIEFSMYGVKETSLSDGLSAAFNI